MLSLANPLPIYTFMVSRHQGTVFHFGVYTIWKDLKQSLRGSLSINALHAYAYIYIRQLSSFRAPTLWFIDLAVATCHIQYSFLSLCQFFSQENGQNMKILKVRHFRMI